VESCRNLFIPFPTFINFCPQFGLRFIAPVFRSNKRGDSAFFKDFINGVIKFQALLYAYKGICQSIAK